uniref:Uncharacterized protein n=1 Tax=Triticum urartu TaxID=4572 RepID=A0A8R7PA62_TRIUA
MFSHSKYMPGLFPSNIIYNVSLFGISIFSGFGKFLFNSLKYSAKLLRIDNKYPLSSLLTIIYQ